MEKGRNSPRKSLIQCSPDLTNSVLTPHPGLRNWLLTSNIFCYIKTSDLQLTNIWIWQTINLVPSDSLNPASTVDQLRSKFLHLDLNTHFGGLTMPELRFMHSWTHGYTDVWIKTDSKHCKGRNLISNIVDYSVIDLSIGEDNPTLKNILCLFYDERRIGIITM